MNRGLQFWLALQLCAAFASVQVSSNETADKGQVPTAPVQKKDGLNLPAPNLPAPNLIRLGEPPVRARLIGIDDSNVWRFREGNRIVRVELPSIVMWGRHLDRWSPARVLLVDGGRLNAEQIDISDDSVVAESRSLGTVRLPRHQVLAVILAPSGDPFERDDLESKIGRDATDSDQLWLLNGDTLTGQLLGSRRPASAPVEGQPVEGQPVDSLDDTSRRRPQLNSGETLSPRPATLRQQGTDSGESSSEEPFLRIRLAESRRIISVPSRRVLAVLFASRGKSQLRDLSGEIITGLRDGSWLRIGTTQISGDQIAIRTTCGFSHQIATEEFVRQLDSVQPRGGRIQYLSDLEPSEYRHIPYLSRIQPYQSDKNVLGGQLRYDRIIAFKGIGMTSTSRLTYELTEPYRQFAALIGLDARAGRRGSAVFRVFVQRGGEANQPKKWESVYVSPMVRGGDPPLDLDIPLDRAQGLSLVVEFGDDADVCDFANWFHARLVPSNSVP